MPKFGSVYMRTHLQSKYAPARLLYISCSTPFYLARIAVSLKVNFVVTKCFLLSTRIANTSAYAVSSVSILYAAGIYAVPSTYFSSCYLTFSAAPFVDHVVDSLISNFYSSLTTISSTWSALYTSPVSGLAFLSNPTSDIDLSTNTDCEDMLAFFGDIVEFAEQDKALLVDAAFDMWFNLNWGAALGALELVLMRLMRRNFLSIFLAKTCRI